MIRFVLLAVALAAGCFASQESPQIPAEVKPTGFGAVSYFEAKCARCHGPQGSFMAQGFAKDQDDAKLTASTKQMAEGPGAAPLNDDELKVEVAYMRAISEGKPFIVWTEAKDGVQGETTAEKMTATVDGKAAPVEVKDGSWALPKGDRVVLQAGEDKKAVTLDLERSNVSQSSARNDQN